MDRKKLEAAVLRAGYAFKAHSVSHWQIVGKFVVNYYPSNGRIYLCGTTGQPKRFSFEIDRLISAATKPPAIVPPAEREGRKSQDYYRRVRRILVDNGRHCRWCDCALTYETATAEHIIPLARGGTNGLDNMDIACAACNSEHGDGNFLDRDDAWLKGKPHSVEQISQGVTENISSVCKGDPF